MTVARPQAAKPEEKPKEDKGLFLQLPYYVIDNLDMTDNAKMGFIRFCRLFNKKNKTIEFRGYYRGLASALKKSPAHTISIVDQWVACNLVQREETGDGVILQANTVAIWHRNKIHKEAEQCLNYEQQRLYTEENTTSAVHEINTTVQNINTAVHNLNTAMKIMNSRGLSEATPEAAAGLIEIASRLLDYTRLLDSFGAPDEAPKKPDPSPEPPEKKYDLDLLCEDLNLVPFDSSFAYSQGQPPTNEQDELEKAQQRIAELERQLSESAGLQEKHVHQSASQTTLIPEEKPAPSSQQNISEKKTPAPTVEPPRFTTSVTTVKKERQEIERRIWKLIDDAVGAKIGRSYTKPMEDLVTGYMDMEYLDEDFTQAVSITKEKKQQLKFTNIVDNMADAVLKRKSKIIQFPMPSLSIDEQIEASRRAAEQYSPKARARREAAERMAHAQ